MGNDILDNRQVQTQIYQSVVQFPVREETQVAMGFAVRELWSVLPSKFLLPFHIGHLHIEPTIPAVHLHRVNTSTGCNAARRPNCLANRCASPSPYQPCGIWVHQVASCQRRTSLVHGLAIGLGAKTQDE